MSSDAALASKISSPSFSAEILVNTLLRSSTALNSSSTKPLLGEDFRNIDMYVSDLLAGLTKLEADLTVKQNQAGTSFQQQKTRLVRSLDKSAKQIGELKTQVMNMESLISEISTLSQAGAEAVQVLSKGKNLQKALFLLQLFNEFVITRLLGGVVLHFEFVPLAKTGNIVIDQLDYEQHLTAGSLYRTAGGNDPEMSLSSTYYSPAPFFVNIDPGTIRTGTIPPSHLGYIPSEHAEYDDHADVRISTVLSQNRIISSLYEDSPFIPPAFRYLLNSPFTRHQALLVLRDMIAAFDMHSMLSVPRFDCLENTTSLWSLLSVPDLRSHLPNPLSSDQLNIATVETISFIKRLYESITSLHSLIPYPPASALTQRMNELVDAANALISAGSDGLPSCATKIAQKYGIFVNAAEKPALELSRAEDSYTFTFYRHRYGLLYELCCTLDNRRHPDFTKARRIVTTMDLLGLKYYELVYESIAYACINANSHLMDKFASNPLLASPELIPDIFLDLSPYTTCVSQPNAAVAATISVMEHTHKTSDLHSDTLAKDAIAAEEEQVSSSAKPPQTKEDVFVRVFDMTKEVFPELTEYFRLIFHILKGLYRICFLTLPHPQLMVLHITQLVLRVMTERINSALTTATSDYATDQSKVSLLMIRVHVVLKSLMEDLLNKVICMDMASLLRSIDVSGISYDQHPMIYGYDFRFSAVDDAKFIFTNITIQEIRRNIALFKESNAALDSIGGINPQIVAAIFAPFGSVPTGADTMGLSHSMPLADSSSNLSPDGHVMSQMDVNVMQLLTYPLYDVQSTNLYSWSYYFDADEEFDSISWEFDKYFVTHYLGSSSKIPSSAELSAEVAKRKVLYEQVQALYITLCDICKGTTSTKTEDQALVVDLDVLLSNSFDTGVLLTKLSAILTGLNKYKAPAFADDLPENYYQRINRGDFTFSHSINNAVAMRLVPQLPAFMSVEIFLNKILKPKEMKQSEDISIIELLSIYEKCQDALIPILTSSLNQDLSLLMRQFLPIYCNSSILRSSTTYTDVVAPWPVIDRTFGDTQSNKHGVAGGASESLHRKHMHPSALDMPSDQGFSKIRSSILEAADYTIRLLFQDYFLHESMYLESYLSGTTMLEPFRSHHSVIDELILNACSKGLSSSLFSEQSLRGLIVRYKSVIYRARYMFSKPLMYRETGEASNRVFYNYRTHTFHTVQTTLVRSILASLAKKIDACVTGYANLCFSAAAGYFPELAVQDTGSMRLTDTTTATYRILPLLVTSPPGVFAVEPISKNQKLATAWKDYGEYMLSVYGGEGLVRDTFSLSQCHISDSGTPLCFGHATIEYSKKGPGFALRNVSPVLLQEKQSTEEHPASVAQSRSFASIRSGLYIPLSDQFFDVVSAILMGIQDIDEFLLGDVLGFLNSSEMSQIVHRELTKFHTSAELALHRLSCVHVELILAGCRMIFCSCRSTSYSEVEHTPQNDPNGERLALMTYGEFCKWASKEGNCMISTVDRVPLHVRYVFELLTNQLSILTSRYDFQSPCADPLSGEATVSRNMLPMQSIAMIAGKVLAAFPTLYLAHLSRFYFRDRDPIFVIAEVKVFQEIYETLLGGEIDCPPDITCELQQSAEKFDLIKAVLISSSSDIPQELVLLLRKCYSYNRAEVLLLLQILARRLSSGLEFITFGEPTRRGGRFKDSTFNKEIDALCSIVCNSK